MVAAIVTDVPPAFLIAGITTGIVSVLSLFILWFISSSDRRTKKLVDYITRLAPSRFQDRGKEWLKALNMGFQSIQRPEVLLIGIISSISIWLIEAATCFMIGISLGLSQDFFIYLMVVAVANLALSIPSTAGGIGPFELAVKESLTFIGFSAVIAADYALVLHGATLIPVTIAGFITLWLIHMPIKSIFRGPMITQSKRLR